MTEKSLKSKISRRDLEFAERLRDVMSNYRKLTDPKFTTSEHISEILKLPTTSDSIRDSKTAIFFNPNATKEHIGIALNDKDPFVAYCAILNPNATEEKIVRGIKRQLESGEVKSTVDLEKEIREEITRWEKVNEYHSRGYERLLTILKSNDFETVSLKDRAKNRTT